tara:strand:+ start:1483 stop:2049 length:567 start_codon:yes stop_codon:yes gene_type:complete
MKNHLVEKLQKAQVFTEPFNHLVIKDLLPDSDFKDLKFTVENTHSGKKPSNLAMEHQTIIDVRNTEEYQDFWHNWLQVFESTEVKEILKQKFNIKENFNHMRCDIHKCEPGFVLGRHNDVKDDIKDIVSLQIYITDNDKNNGVVLDDIKHIANDPNTAWSFACGEDTWHSVDNVTRTRHSVLMKYLVQ